MLTYPEINPIIVELGPLALRWYGLTYLVGFGLFWWLGRLRAKRPDTPVEAKHIDDLVFYGALGAVIGGRIGYMLFYNTAALLENPLSLFYIHQGGMASHGGLLGALAVAVWMKRKIGCGFLQLTDFVAPLVPLGFAAGRIGNFINGELWGGPGDVPWAMRVSCESPRFQELCFQQLGLPAGSEWTPPLHPSQLYQFALEGLTLFIILWLFTKRPRPVGAASGLFLLGYGGFRFLVEFVRMPDAHLDYLAFGWVTMGQILSLPMILGGLGLMIWAYKRAK